MGRRNGVRFVVALALGIRQGEALGLKWSKFDATKKTLQINQAMQRRKWEHGCDQPHECGAKYHKAEPCKKDCFKHKRACPPPCRPNCVEHARNCPERRGIALPDQLAALLVVHKATQNREREFAGTVWQDGGWMFAQPDGRPIDPRSDWEEWKNLLIAAHVRDGRLHDARHTAATVLLVLGVPTRAVEYFMGWSNGTMARRYQHVVEALKRDIADQTTGTSGRPRRTGAETRNRLKSTRAWTENEPTETADETARPFPITGGAAPSCSTKKSPSSANRTGAFHCGRGRGRTADLPLFRRSLVPTELPDRAGRGTGVASWSKRNARFMFQAVLTGFEPAAFTLTG